MNSSSNSLSHSPTRSPTIDWVPATSWFFFGGGVATGTSAVPKPEKMRDPYALTDEDRRAGTVEAEVEALLGPHEHPDGEDEDMQRDDV